MAARKKEPQAAATMEQVRPERPEQPPFIMEGRTLENTFTELEREGKACLYELLKAAVGKMPRTFFTLDRRRWSGALHNEQKDLLIRFLCDGGTVVYGSTFLRARAKWDAEGRMAPPRQLTEEERRYVIDVPEEQGGGTIHIGPAPERGTTVPLENLFTYWIEEFTAEVEKAVEAFSQNPNATTELQRITNALRSFEVGTNGKLILQPMQADAAGKDLLAKFEHAKSRLSLRLEETAAPLNSGRVAAAPARSSERLEWEGSTIEFITIMKMLVKRKYVELPSTGGKQGEGNVSEFIRRFQQTFIVRKDDETEFTTEGLADRWRGRPMGVDREKQFDIPEAMPSIVMMEKDREGKFDIPDATRKRPST